MVTDLLARIWRETGAEGAGTAPSLDLPGLEKSGVRGVDAFAREYPTVTTGKDARQPFPLRPWQKAIVRAHRSGGPEAFSCSRPRGCRSWGIRSRRSATTPATKRFAEAVLNR
jgi:hypothetical protein